MMNRFLLQSLALLSIVLLFPEIMLAQTPEDIQKIISSYDLAKLKALENQFSQQYQTDKKQALRWAKRNHLPIFKSTKDGVFKELQGVTPEGTPLYFAMHDQDAVNSARANYLHFEGGLGLNLMGQNMTAYIWDGGHPRVTHFEYDGLGGENRVSIEDAASEGGVQLLWHAAMVTGIVASAGYFDPEAKGMAPYCRTKNYKWSNDLAEATAAAANGMLLSNHSYGLELVGLPNYYPGGYTIEAVNWDNLLFNAPYYLMVTSAGNDGAQGYRKIVGRQMAKNCLTVSSALDATLDNFGNLVSTGVQSLSSIGPGDELRIKPDICGNGTTVKATASTDDYSNNTNPGATSFAAPNITGSLLLLQQHYKNVNGSFMKAATLKGLALHTADDVDMAGPDAKAGWGLINAKKAAETISRNGTKSIISELTLISGQTYTLNVNADGINQLMASISWTDAPGTEITQVDSPVSRLVNDLDIRITKAANTYFPYKLLSDTTNGLGDNTVDPYERIDVAGATGTYTITVSHKGTLNSGSQNFSLIVTGIANNCNVAVPTDLNYQDVTQNTAVVKWNSGVEGFYTLRYRILGAPAWSTATTSEKMIRLTGLTAFSNYEVQIQGICPGGATSAFSNTLFFTTSGTYCTSVPLGLFNIYSTELNTLNNITLNNNVPYENFTNLTTNLIKSETNTVKITTESGSSGVGIWIDYNCNGVFTDSGELVFSQASSASNIKTGNFIVPQTALSGGTRMRIVIKANGSPTPCETNFTGQVEDYTVIIKNTACAGQTIWNGTGWSNGAPNADVEAILSGNYSGNGFSACTLSVTGSAQVTVPSGQNLMVEGQVNVASGANLTFENNANLLQRKGVVNTGNIKIKRSTAPLKRLDYAMWSSPVANQNLQAFSPQTLNTRFYTYDSSTNLYTAIDPATHNFTNSTGYLIRMPNNHPTTPTIWTGEFTGNPNNGTLVTNVPEFSYVAVGNPYPSAIDLYPFVIENQIYDALYFWRKENNSQASSYTTYTAGLGAVVNSGDPNGIAPERYIPVGQGFIFYTSLPTLTFRNSYRVADNKNVFLRSAEANDSNRPNSFHLNVSNNAAVSCNAMIGYLAGATSTVDAFIDGRYINDSPNALTSLIDGEEFTLQGRGLPFDDTDEVPLGFKTQVAGDYWLSLTSVSGFFTQEQAVFLEDSQTQTVHDLKSGPYQFSSEPGVFNNRFKIKYRNGLLATTNPMIPDQVSVRVKNSVLTIAAQNSLLKAIHLFDLTGRKLMGAEDLSLKESQFDLTAYQRQVLLVKIETADGKTVTHRIVN